MREEAWKSGFKFGVCVGCLAVGLFWLLGYLIGYLVMGR